MRFRSLLVSLFAAAAVTVAACHHQAAVTGVSVEQVEMNRNGGHDSATAAMIAPYKDSLDAIMTQVVGRSAVAMPKERDKLETLLGNFVADVCLDRVNRVYQPSDNHGADFCLLNTGGLRSSLPQGNLTRGNIFELMPFDNEMVVVTLSGQKTWELLRYLAASGGQPVAGIKMGIRPDKTPGTTLIKGVTFDSTRTYKVVTSDYLANGGDKMDFFRNPVKLETTGYKIRDAILDYLAEQQKNNNIIQPALDGRMYYETK